MKEQTFVIDGDTVTFAGLESLDQDQAERWYRMYRSGGTCPFAVQRVGDGNYDRFLIPEGWKSMMPPLERAKGFSIRDAFQPPPEGYIEHIQEHEREATEDYIEYCKYAQKLQTELSEASIFIQDEMNNIGLELAEIEERRIDLNALEVDLERQMAYLRTLQSITNKRKSELNKEYGEVAKTRGSGEPKTSGRTEMDKEHNNNQDG